MCGRVVWVWDAKTGMLVMKYDDRATDDPDVRHVLEKNRYNVPPASHLPVIAGEGGRTPVRVARWGFPIPQRPNGVFNTRVETAIESPMWRQLLGSSHCVLPVKGFYEWRRDAKRSAPHFIHRTDGEPMLLAGVTGTRDVAGKPALCFSIVTCAPDALVARLHDRMPVVLESAGAQDWLRPREVGLERVLELARPASDVLSMHEVDPAVNSTENDDPRLIVPRPQSRLF